MDIGIPKETLAREHRVALTPDAVRLLAGRGHRLFVEKDAGTGAGHADADYEAAGATVAYSREEVLGRAELLLGVGAPKPSEYARLESGQTVLAFWSLPAAHAEDLRALMDSGATAIGYEVIVDDDGKAPALMAMSEIAGSLAPIMGAGLMLNEFGGKGILLTGAPGVPPANIVILGTGVLGRAAARTAVGLGADVLLMDSDIAQLRHALTHLPHHVPTEVATPHSIERALGFADLVIASPAARGERAPVLVTREMLRKMKKRSVFMDLSIDMGGCAETSRPSYFPDPAYVEEGVRHFCVPNLPSIVARSSTRALTNTVLPWVMELADCGVDATLMANRMLRRGTYLHHGACAMESLGELFNLPVTGRPSRPLGASR